MGEKLKLPGTVNVRYTKDVEVGDDVGLAVEVNTAVRVELGVIMI